MTATARPACAVGLILLTLSGCVKRIDKPFTPPPISKVAYTPKNFTDDLADYNDAAKASQRRDLRDRMAYSLMAEIEYAYQSYAASLFVTHGVFGVGSDFVQLGLAAAGTVSKGERGKSILAALLSGVTGVSLSYDKNFFRQQTIQAIKNSMESSRNDVRTRIVKRLIDEDVDTYPFQAARADLIEFFFAGTLEGGLQQLHENSATAAAASKQDFTNVIPVSKPDLKAAFELRDAIDAALKSDDHSKVVEFLKALGAQVDNKSPVDVLRHEAQTLGIKTFTDAKFRRKYFDAARKAGLIQ